MNNESIQLRYVDTLYYRWETIEDKDIKIQIHKNHKLLEDIK